MVDKSSQRSGSVDQLEFMAFLEDAHDIDVAKQCIASLKISPIEVFDGGINGAIKYLTEHRSPKVLMVDITKVDMPVNVLNSLSEVCEPGTKVITVGAKNDVGLYRDLMALGISEYVVKPIISDIMMNAVRSLLDGGDKPKKINRTGKVITFVGARGGVGTTMMATSFAWIMSQVRSRRVVIVDLDLHTGTVSLYLDQKPNHGLREALENPDRIDPVYLDRVLTKISDRLQILSAEEPLGEAPDFTIDGLDTLIEFLIKQFHYVIIDMPRRYNIITRSVLQHTHTLTVVAEPSLASARDTERLIRLFGPFGGDRRMITVLNKIGNYKNGEVRREEFESSIGKPVDITVPYDNTYISELLNRGRPIVDAPNSKILEAVNQLADFITGDVHKNQEDSGLFDKLFSIIKQK